MQLVFIIGIVQKSISAKTIIGNIGKARSKTMTEGKYGDSYGEKFRKYEDRITELEKRLKKAELIINHLLLHAEFSCYGTVNDWKIKEAKKFLKENGK